MIIKILKIISCSSEHTSYPSSNLLDHPPKSSWRCAKPKELIATVILQLAEPSCLSGLEIGNYRSCIVIVEASTSKEPDKWFPVINHQFLSHDEAANNKFRDQVQIFTKREINPEIVKIKFDRVKVTCMQSANPRELFGLKYIIIRTEITVDLGLDVFGRFKLKEKNDDNTDEFKEKYLKLFGNKKKYKDELKQKISETGINNFTKRLERNREPKKRQILEKLEAVADLDSVKPGSSSSINSPLFTHSANRSLKNDDSQKKVEEAKKLKDENTTLVARTLFGDVIPSPKNKPKSIDKWKLKKIEPDMSSKKRSLSPQCSTSDVIHSKKKVCCYMCKSKSDELCPNCELLYKSEPFVESIKKKPIKVTKPKKEFTKLFEDVSFSLSGYVNPQRDDVRRKALTMGAKYVASPNITNNKCTHLICAFKNTPKLQQLKGHCKIVGHQFIEDCFNSKKRISWRQYALDNKEKNKPESEEEVEGSTSPINVLNCYNEDTDDSDTNY